MKTRLIIITISVLSLTLNSQVTTPFNVGVPTDFVGFQPFQLFPLNIEHQDATLVAPALRATWPIVFKTSTFERMRIENLTFGALMQTGRTLTNPMPGSQMTRVRVNYDGALQLELFKMRPASFISALITFLLAPVSETG